MFIKDQSANEAVTASVTGRVAIATRAKSRQARQTTRAGEGEMNAKNTTTEKTAKQLPTPPKFVDHEELHGRWAYEKLFGRLVDHETLNNRHANELHRFKQMHYCARQIRDLLKQHQGRALRLKSFQRFAATHQQIRDAIAADNLGLVYELYKKSRIVNADGDELLSEGMMALTRSIDTFNPWRGFRFSTYACNSILRAFYRCGLKETRRRQLEPVNFETQLEKSDWLDTQREEDTVLYAERLTKILSNGTAELTPIERAVIEQRFPLNETSERKTLAEIGRDMDLSKERVRQIQNSALLKLRDAIELDPVLN